MTLTVGNLFCGSGGFAEGFRQAGFEVAWAVDQSDAAVETMRWNHPDTKVIQANVTRLKFEGLSKVDVLVGGPPCTFFSLANRGGNGDVRLGLKLVRGFLKAVKVLRPRYWIMENVPNLRRVADSGRSSLGRNCPEIPTSVVLKASDYGTAQSRRRLFWGDFPLPQELEPAQLGDRITLGHILTHFPDPSKPVSKRSRVADPLYESVKIPVSRLRGHFEDSRWALSEEEVAECIRTKTQHPWCGRMDFPDRLNRPSRTITATRLRASRATIVVRRERARKVPYRTLTQRECASVQGFPLVYQFWGKTFAGNDRLIGNAVPPPVSFALARAILKKEGEEEPATPRVYEPALLPPLLKPRRGPSAHRFPLGRRFRRHAVCEWLPECRVELDNAGHQPSMDPSTGLTYSKEWVTRLYLGYARRYRCYELGTDDLATILNRLSLWVEGPAARQALLRLCENAIEAFKELPDASNLQDGWAGRMASEPSPLQIVRGVDRLVNRHVPRRVWSRKPIPPEVYVDVLMRRLVASGKEAVDVSPVPLTIRTLAAAAGLTIACDTINRSSRPTPQITQPADDLSTHGSSAEGPLVPTRPRELVNAGR